MAAIPVNLVIEKGTDFEASFNITNEDGSALNLLGYTASCRFKKSYTASTFIPVTVNFVSRPGGIISIIMTNTETNALERRRYAYEIVITSPSNYKTRVVEGVATVTGGL
jgi:hypothetical protein